MLHGIFYGFLGDAKESEGVVPAFDEDWLFAAELHFGGIIRQFLQRFHQAGTLQIDRAITLRERSSLIDGSFEDSAKRAEDFHGNWFTRGDGAANGLQQHGSAGEGLTDIVVQFVADLALFAFY